MIRAIRLRHALSLRDEHPGGSGFYIQTYLRLLNYPAASTVLLVLVGLVMIVDFASSRLRARLV